MHGQANATNATFEQLANAGWFSAVGSLASDSVSTVSSWAEAIEQCAWAAAGFKDTLLRWKMKPEVVHGNEKAIQPRVQA
jgi:hypothetical protein